MSRKKSKSNTSGLVYSTVGGRHCPQCRRPALECICSHKSQVPGGDGIVRIRRETKGRGGKAVTVITGLPGTPEQLKQIGKELKQLCGTGGSAKDGQIEIQGDKRDPCRTALEAKGYLVKLSGG